MILSNKGTSNSSNKMLVIRVGTHKMLLRRANREDPDLGLPCLSRPFYQAIGFQNFRRFTILTNVAMENKKNYNMCYML